MLCQRIKEGDDALEAAIERKASQEYAQALSESQMRIREDLARLNLQHDTLRQDISQDIKDLAASLKTDIREGLREVTAMINLRSPR